jgi:signal peptidase I
MRWWWRCARARVAAAVSALVVAWALFAPRAFGGGVDYLILNGDSMAPRFVRGDLVLVRPAPFYRVGDIVAYRHPEIGPVFHRIIAQSGERFILQGDHNTWVDGYQPTAAEILGKLWWHLPGFGRVILTLRTPPALAALSGLLVFVVGVTLMTPSSPASSRARLRRHARQALTTLSGSVAAHAEAYLIALYITGFLALILGAFAFTRPRLLQVPAAVAYTQRGSFAYTAPLRASGVYDADHVPSGGAIFPRLSCTVTLTFAYHLESAAPFEGGGSYRLQAEVAAPNGWKRVFPLQPEERFSGNAFQTRADLNVCLVEQLLRQTEAITGVQPYQYTLTINPNVQVLGALDGAPLQTTFAPALAFTVEKQQIYLRREGGSEQDPLAPVSAGTLTRTVTIPNTLPIFGWALPVDLARGIAGVGLGIALLGLLVLYGVEAWTTRRAPALAARLRAGGQVVEIDRPLTLMPTAQVVRVKQYADLLRLAEKTTQPLFLYADPAYLEYYLRADGTLYVYREAPLSALTAAEIRSALEEGQFALYYQPGIALDDGRITHLEALLRWHHPVRGLLTAAAFWPQIEAAGLAVEVDRWVLHQVVAHLRTWDPAGSPPFAVAINLALATLQIPGWAEEAHQRVLAAGISPARLIFEIPPDAPLEDPQVAQTLRALHQAGFSIALNTVSDVDAPAWQALPAVDVVKLGYPLLQRLVQTANATEALGRWIAAAHQAQTHVAAVGVETLQQLRLFRAQACDRAQGYLISPPLAAEDVPLFLARRERLLDPLWLAGA